MQRSRLRVVVLISGLLLVSSSAIMAQTTQPAPSIGAAASPQPSASVAPSAATRPSPADPSGPRGALEALVGAMQSGDVPKIKTLIATTNPTEDKMVDAMATMAVSQKRFRNAADAAYGANAKELTGDTDAGMAEGLAKIDAAPETITGDSATVDPSGQPGTPPLTLKKVAGQWRIPISQLARGVDQNTIQQRLDDLSFMSKMMDESADEVSKGMYKTPKDAGEAIKSKMMVAMMKRANAGTQPATQAAPDAAPPAPTPPSSGM
jgi:hypothetical protein